MNALEFVTKYNGQISTIGATMAANKVADKAASNAKSGRSDSLADQVRGFVKETAADGVSIEDGRAGLIAGLTMLGLPSGSVKASGVHYAGFRRLLDQGVDIDTKSTAEAQKAMESDEVKRTKAAKSKLNDYAKSQGWKAADWEAMLENIGVTDTESTEEADEAVVQEARAAA